MKITERITKARKLLQETTKEFGDRFGKDNSTVTHWEKGTTQAPYNVIEFAEQVLEVLEDCPACDGSGVFNKKQSAYVIALGKEGMDMVYPAGEFHYKRTKPASLKMIAGKPETAVLHFEVDALPKATSVSEEKVNK